MSRVSLSAYPWDLIDEGLDDALDRLRSQIGFTGLTVWGVVPSMTQLRVRAVEPRVFSTNGGLLFHPSENCYSASRCKPMVADWVKHSHALRTIAEAWSERELELRIRMTAATVGRLGQRQPEMATRNVFGAPSTQSVCLANPDVQAYLCGLVADLCEQYEPSGLVVGDFLLGWFEAFGADLQTPVLLRETDRALLATCACESCRQKAGDADVDVDTALHSVRQYLDNTLSSGQASDASLGSIVEDNPALADFCRWRADELSSLLKRLTDTCTCELLLDRGSSGAQRWQLSDSAMGIPAAVVTQVECADGLASGISRSAARNELRIPACAVLRTRDADFVSLLGQAIDCGYSGIEIDHYGAWPETAFTKIRQAVRSASRTRGG